MESVEELCDYICLINKSQKVLEGKLDDVKNRFKKNKFKVVVESNQPISSGKGFEVISYKSINDNKMEFEIQLSDSSNQKEVFDVFCSKGRIESFSEIIPSASDIFINTVNQNSNG